MPSNSRSTAAAGSYEYEPCPPPNGFQIWPATPDSGVINEAWDRTFLEHWCETDREALCDYTDGETYREAGQGGFEIRTYISVAAACAG